MLALALAVSAGGCRQVLGIDDPTTIEMPDHDAPVADTPAPVDAAVDGHPIQTGTCMERWFLGPQFASITHVDELDGGIGVDVDSPFLLSDELVIYYVRGGDIYRAERPSIADPFDNPQPVGGLTSPSAEGKAYVNDSETRAFFASARSNGSGGFDLFRGTANGGGGNSYSVDKQFVSTLDDGTPQLDPHFTADLLDIYYANGTPSRITQATRATVNDNFGTPAEVKGLSGTLGADSGPTLTPDQRVIVFASNRGGDLDLYYATRATAGADFSAPKVLDGVDLKDVVDTSPHVSADGCRVYFATDRGGGGKQLFVASMN